MCGRAGHQPGIYLHQRTSPFCRKKCAPQLAFSQMEGARVGRQSRSTLMDHRFLPASGSSIWSPHFGHNKCAHFKCPSRISTVTRFGCSSSDPGDSGAAFARNRGLCRKRSRKRYSASERGRHNIASGRLIQERSHIAAPIKFALAAQRAIWIPLTSWNTVGILDPIEPPNVLCAVPARPSKTSQTVQ